MRFTRRWKIALVAAPVVGTAGFGMWAFSQSPRSAEAAAIRVSATPGTEVQRIERLTCEADRGWPVVMVRATASKEPWWVQASCEHEAENRFQARVHFGNEKTLPGARYQMIVLTVADAAAAAKFAVGSQLEEIPVHLPHSEPIEVVRK